MKKFITLGLIDKKIFLPFILAAYLIITGYIGAYLPTCNQSYYISGFGVAFGFMLAKLIPFIFRYQTNISFSKICTKSNAIDYTICFVSYGIYRGILLYNHFIKYDTKRVGVLISNQSLEIIVLLVISWVCLKYKYYIHNLISLISFCIFSIIIDLVSGNLQKLQPADGYYAFVIISEDIFYIIMKWMIDRKYHKYWDIIFFQGVSFFIFMSIATIIRIKIDGIDFIKDYFSKEEIGAVSAIFFYNVFISGLFQQILNVLIIYLFTPNHMLIAYGINKMKKILSVKTENNYQYFCLIPFFFQILSLFFYLEILELNFCGLNKNTKKNIRLREKMENVMRESKGNENDVEINDNLIIKSDELNRELTIFENNEGRNSNQS